MPAKPTHAHGALFDSVPQGLQSLHGGARFDEGFQLQDKGAPKGDTYDEFGKPADPDQGGHGPVWDEWGWKDMPDIHGGLLFDDGFGEETAHETSRGPLFDLFEPSTQVKFIYDGQDAEGIVNQVRSDGIVEVTPRKGGKPVEVGLEQFLAYRSPSMDNTGTTAEASEAEAPSAWSSDARGGTHNQIPVPSDAGAPSGSIDPGSPVEATPQGSSVPENARDGLDADWSPIQSLKSALGELDVTKAASTPLDHLHAAAGHLARGGESRLLKANTHLQGALDHRDLHPGSESFSHTHRALEHTENALLGGRGRTPEEHTARALHHTQTAERLHKIGKATIASPLDVLKAGEQKSPFHSRYTHQAFPGDEHRHFADGQHIGTSSGSGGDTVKHAWAHSPGASRRAIVEGPKLGKFPSHEAAHVAIVEHHMDTHKTAASPLDVLKAGKSGYRMERHGDIGDGEGGGIRDMHQHFAGQRFIGRSYRFSPGGPIKAQHTHPRSGAMTHLGEHPTHDHAHRVIRAHDESDAAKSASSPVDVLKTTLDVAKASTIEGNGYKGIDNNGSGTHIFVGRGRKGSEQQFAGSSMHIGMGRYRATSASGVHLGEHGGFVDAHRAIVAHDKSMRARYGTANKTVSLPSDVLKSCSVFDGERAVAKEVTVAESAIQAQEGASTLAGGKGAGSTYCPECREQKSLTDDGRCPDCNMVLDSHEPGKAKREKGDGNGQGESSATKTFVTVEDLAKAFGAAGDPGAGGQTVTSDGDPGSRGQQKGSATSWPGDVPMDAREHKTSDHNSETEESHSAGATCPHCGQPLKELDEKTEQGAPAHKCVEALLAGDVTKTTEEPVSAFAQVKALVA